eukprot:TRINITY_DN68156_c5_g4_i1.p1 TRINITY_DN68156_c5_g4~~TRINITY_DN68156_c5_g4_i1.p1  ORF type:complete len:332 (-),score=73.61 TRINITY_DN68156_c5_g4_i1:39-1034(-)
MFKFLALLVAVVSANVMNLDDMAVRQNMVDEINEMNTTWTASADQGSFFDGMTLRQAKGLCGAWLSPADPADEPMNEIFIEAPTSFDSAKKWPQCKTIMDIRDQSECGSCWAVAAAEAMTDRYCTYLGGKNKKYLSVQLSAGDLMSCCKSCGSGCEGGFPGAAWNYWNQVGLPDLKCDPYPFPKCEHHIPKNHYPKCPSTVFPTPQCNMTCDTTGKKPTQMYFGQTSFSLNGEAKFQQEIMTNGPIEVTFEVYEDFLTYKSGVYKHVSGRFLGGHAVKAVGWGVTAQGTKYWIINNSWNKDWGMNGQFWILRGVNECGIESSGTAGAPKPF